MSDDILQKLDEIDKPLREEGKRTRTNQAQKRLATKTEEPKGVKGEERREKRELITCEKEEKNEYIKIIVSVESSINKALERFIADQKEGNVKIFDNINQVKRKISKSAWVNLLVEDALRKEGYIID